ncbi:cyclic nucleotide-binding domain-containing protein [Alphaproteobacteria bacterium]|nr:cyclic nucleotide-binding domain-containing protein [Alphaproteobacteria bacterium]
MSFFDANTDLSKMFSSRTLEKNDVLFREGDTLGDAYIIKFGEIEIRKHENIVELVTEGEIVGIFNVFFDNKVRMFTAVALTKGEVFIIPEEYLRGLLEKSDPFVRYCFRTFLPLLKRFSEQFDKKDSNQNKKDKAAKEEEKFNKMKMSK